MLAQQTGRYACYLRRPGDPDNTTVRGEGGFVSERGRASRGREKKKDEHIDIGSRPVVWINI